MIACMLASCQGGNRRRGEYQARTRADSPFSDLQRANRPEYGPDIRPYLEIIEVKIPRKIFISF
jgi:hypothetical protein